jgi:F420-0:gamma-glutamyl ligase-like protein
LGAIRAKIGPIFHVFSEARDNILILNILFFNELRQMIPEIRSERRDLLIFNFFLKTTGTFTPVHSAGYLKLKYGLSLLKIHEKCKKYIFRIIFYVSLIKNDTSVILHPVDGPLTEYLNTCVTIFGNNQKRNAYFVTR